MTENQTQNPGFGKGLAALIAIMLLAAVLIGPTASLRRDEPSPANSEDEPQRTSTSREPSVKAEEEKPSPSLAARAADAAPRGIDDAVQAPRTGRELYVQHCAACHGEQGDGIGLAARFLFPKPRDFRAGKFRLVSTNNNVPTRADLDAILVRGMPGSAMPPWPQLTDAERGLLVDEVLKLWREGIRQQYLTSLKDDEGLSDEEIADEDIQQEIDEFAERRMAPGESSVVPEFDLPDNASIARGKLVYFNLSCHSCHGNEGKGDGAQKMFDDEGMPSTARDYTQGIFKGGHDPASLYRRIAYGMPGTPMPATLQATPRQMTDLVHFLRSLSDEPTRQAALLTRETITAKAVDALPETADPEAWSATQPVPLKMVPLWWRNDADPNLLVQAVHDGTTLALRLDWKDETADEHATRSESFEDAIGVELYRGPAEPFIGMGDPRSPVDVWFWDADRQSPRTVEDTYPNVVVDIYPFHESVVDTALFDRPGTRDDAQPEVSLPALATGNSIVPATAGNGSSSLTGGGPGSVTFRLPKSQLVTANGQWNDGRWTVVMTRALQVEPDDGISLDASGKASIAFAIWDGSQQERDGMKLITIWQDFIVE